MILDGIILNVILNNKYINGSCGIIQGTFVIISIFIL